MGKYVIPLKGKLADSDLVQALFRTMGVSYSIVHEVDNSLLAELLKGAQERQPAEKPEEPTDVKTPKFTIEKETVTIPPASGVVAKPKPQPTVAKTKVVTTTHSGKTGYATLVDWLLENKGKEAAQFEVASSLNTYVLVTLNGENVNIIIFSGNKKELFWLKGSVTDAIVTINDAAKRMLATKEYPTAHFYVRNFLEAVAWEIADKFTETGEFGALTMSTHNNNAVERKKLKKLIGWEGK